MSKWLKRQYNILVTLYNFGRDTFDKEQAAKAKERLKPKRAKHTFKAGKLAE